MKISLLQPAIIRGNVEYNVKHIQVFKTKMCLDIFISLLTNVHGIRLFGNRITAINGCKYCPKSGFFIVHMDFNKNFNKKCNKAKYYMPL